MASVLEMARDGQSITGIVRATGLPFSTVRRWVVGKTPHCLEGPPTVDRLLGEVPPDQFGYLLGLYLGDGHIASVGDRGVFRLCVYMDSGYPNVVKEAAAAMSAVMPRNSVSIGKRSDSNCSVIACFSKAWPTLFPQHGPGRKHDRRIQLTAWQRAITKDDPRPLIRGLVHSDGCRAVATVRRHGREYRYPRYYFANKSEDIKGIFCEHLDLLGIRWTRPNEKLIQIARREAVAALDEFIGPKR